MHTYFCPNFCRQQISGLITLVFLLSNISSPPTAHGQETATIDSLERALGLALNKTDSFAICDELFWQTVYTDPNVALGHARTAQHLAAGLNDATKQHTGLSNLASAFFSLFELDSAANYAQAAIGLAEEMGDSTRMFKSMGTLSNAIYYQGQHEEAIRLAKAVKGFHEQADDTEGLLKSLNNLGGLHQGIGRNITAIGYLVEAARVAEELGDKKVMAFVNQNIGVNYSSLKEYDRAQPYFLKSLPFFSELGFVQQKINSLNNLGENYVNLGEPEKAKGLFEEALELNTMKVPQQLAHTYFGLSRVELANEDFKAALGHCEKALEVDMTSGYHNKVFADYLHLARIHNRSGQYKKAHQVLTETVLPFLGSASAEHLKMHKEYLVASHLSMQGERGMKQTFDELLTIQDSLYSAERFGIIAEVEEKYQARLRQDSIQVLAVENQLVASERDRNRSSMWLFAALAGLFLSLSAVLYYFFKNKKAQSDRLARDKEILETANLGLRQNLSEKERQLQSPDLLAEQSITLTNREKTVLRLRDILYLKGEGRAVRIITAEEKHRDWQMLKNYETVLPENLFVRSHRSYLVNVLHIKELTANKLKMSDGEELNIGETYKADLQKLFRSVQQD